MTQFESGYIDGGYGVLLRRMTPDDAKAQADLVQANLEHISQFGNTAAEGFDTVENAAQTLQTEIEAGRFRFGVFQADNPDEMLGNVKFDVLPDEQNVASNGGFWIAEQATRKGIGAAALATGADYAFEELGVDLMGARVRHGNFANARTLRKNDFVLSAAEAEHWQFYKFKQPPGVIQAMLDEPITFFEQQQVPEEASTIFDVYLHGMTPSIDTRHITDYAVADGQAFALTEDIGDVSRFVPDSLDIDPVFVFSNRYTLNPGDSLRVMPGTQVQLLGSAAMKVKVAPSVSAGFNPFSAD